MAKPKFTPYYHKATGKFFTGYVYDLQCHIRRGISEYEAGADHEVKHLRLRYTGTCRGRSAVNFIFLDDEGFEYIMSCSTFDALMKCVCDCPVNKAVVLKSTMGGNIFFEGDFKQVKQGQNYFIAPNI